MSCEAQLDSGYVATRQILPDPSRFDCPVEIARMLPHEFLSQNCCLFDRRGRLLWRSPAWTGGAADPIADRAVLGYRYLEFVRAADVAPLLVWFADARESTHSFCCMLPSSGRMARISYAKLNFGAAWLVFGAVSVCSRPCALNRCTLGASLLLAASFVGDLLAL